MLRSVRIGARVNCRRSRRSANTSGDDAVSAAPHLAIAWRVAGSAERFLHEISLYSDPQVNAETGAAIRWPRSGCRRNEPGEFRG